MTVEERPHYTYTCDGCELIEEMENDLLPQDWSIITENGTLPRDQWRHFCPGCVSELDEKDPDGDD